MNKKVACNATNSLAIDNHGNLWVWGSTRYGLCGEEKDEKAEPDKGKDGELDADDVDYQTKMKSSSVNKPRKLQLKQGDLLDIFEAKDKVDEKGKEFSAFDLLDPDPKFKDQVNCALHVSCGSYHGGVVTNDISTDYEFTPLPSAQQEVLQQFKEFLLKYWKELDNQDNEDIQRIQTQHYKKQEEAAQLKNPGGAKETAAGKLGVSVLMKKAGGGSVKGGEPAQPKRGEVPVQMKIEFMLRFFFRIYMRSTFPFVPQKELKKIMVTMAKMNFKDQANINKLFSHLVKCAKLVLDQPNMASKREYYKQGLQDDDYINLKELRDQILGRRCSNGKLYMFGVANEKRLGVYVKEIDELLAKQKANQKEKEFIMITKGLQLVQFVEAKENIMVSKVECGSSFTLVLTTKGHLYAWGFGKSGSLGLGETSATDYPKRIEKLLGGDEACNMKDISCGSSHSLAIDEAGKMYSWGNGQGGRLGHGQEVGENEPRQILKLDGKTVKFIEAGDASSAAITHDLYVYMWGSGLNGRLGNGEDINQLEPSLSQELKEKQVASITMGTNSSFALLENQKVFAWGSSNSGKLGFKLANGKNYMLPKEIIELKAQKVVLYQIAAGPFHTLLLTRDGKVFTMGNSKDGKLGFEIVGGGIQVIDTPQRIKEAPVFFCHTKAKTRLKEYPLFNDYDEVGRLRPVFNKDAPYEVNQLACGDNFQLFLMNNGLLYSCGSNKVGQLGTAKKTKPGTDSTDEDDTESDEGSEEEEDGEELPKAIRKKIDDLERKKDRVKIEPITRCFKEKVSFKVQLVAVGGMHAVAILQNDAGVFSWGSNSHGQLGLQKQDIHMSFLPYRIKNLGGEAACKQVACGENHTVFLMGTGGVLTCGANEFGQCGLAQDAAVDSQAGGKENFWSPTVIEKSYLENVVYVACGRFHTIAVRKQNDGENNVEDEDEGANGGNTQSVQQDLSDPKDKKGGEKEVVVDIKHDIYAWGRGYHGQLGLKNLKVIQWVPQKVRIRRDPRFKEEDQPTRFAMVSAGEKATLLLAVNGAIWWAGDKHSVGLVDPREARQNKYEPKNEEKYFAYAFSPYFDPTSYGTYGRMKFKYIKANFNSKRNFAINDANELCQFGDGIPFQRLETENKYIYADGGKNFQTLVHVERLPYTWGNIKHGKLGIDIDDEEIKEQLENLACYDEKKKVFTEPTGIPFFQQVREDVALPKRQEDVYRMKYNQVSNFEQYEQEIQATAQANFKMKFEVQQILKQQDQGEFEERLIQQDLDLMINFNTSIQNIYNSQQKQDRQTRQAVMKATDAITARIQTFPIPNIEKLENIEVQIPKPLILNKQIYELLFTLLQTHPCYLIKWLCAGIRNEIDLFDDHPQAFIQEDEANLGIMKMQDQYHNVIQKDILHDEYCYLLIVVFGGLKTIRNDRRIINNLMTIGIKVFDYELKQSTDPSPQYPLESILNNRVETVFQKIHKMIFQSQTQNILFMDEIFEKIVRRLFADKSKYTDGLEGTPMQLAQEEEQKNQTYVEKTLDVFDYESVITHPELHELRAENLKKFLETVMEDILLLNVDFKKRIQKENTCSSFFSSEILLMTLKAHDNLTIKTEDITRKAATSRDGDAEALKEAYEDQINSFCLRVLFTDLCVRLQHLRAHDIINIVGQKAYEISPVLNVTKVRNNFYYLGDALRKLLTGGKVTFSSDCLQNFRDLVDCKKKNYRVMLMEQIKLHKSRDDVMNFDQLLVQQTIEEAMEPVNPICTVQLRNIVYVHNQLVSYGEKHIYVKGFEENRNVLGGLDVSVKSSAHAGSDDDEDQDDDDQESVLGEDFEQDPIKIIMKELGDQFIILKVYEKTFISQEVLDKSINLLIRTRIFENFNEIVKCNVCNAIVYESLLPAARVQEGLKMKTWACGQKKCHFYNTQKTSMFCEKCGKPRPRDTLPSDLVFPIYVPQDPSIELNAQVIVMEKLLQQVPPIDIAEDVEEKLMAIKKQEKDQEQKDFDKINIIDSFLKMREKYIQKQKDREGRKFERSDEEAEFVARVEGALYLRLEEEIDKNIQRRKEHQQIIDRNNFMIREIVERQGYIDMRQKQLMQGIATIQQNAKIGIGSDCLLELDATDGENIKAGKLQELTKKNGDSKDQKKQDEEMKNVVLDAYFEKMAGKQNMKINNPRLQRQLDLNRERRNKMKDQFGQFSSFPAKTLMDEGVVVKIKIGGKNIDQIMKKCSYIFYEMKDDDENDQEGGYKVELSFEEKMQDFSCGINIASLTGGQPQVSNSNQSILSTFIITNTVLAEMQRLMATKCTVNLSGTEFNIFNLVKLVSKMKTKNNQYADGDPAETKKTQNNNEEN